MTAGGLELQVVERALKTLRLSPLRLSATLMWDQLEAAKEALSAATDDNDKIVGRARVAAIEACFDVLCGYLLNDGLPS